MLWKKTCIALLIIVIAATVGCSKAPVPSPGAKSGDAAFPLTITDDADRQVTIEKAPLRLLSLAPSHTEILFALGLGDRLVGVTTYCDYPAAAKDKPKIGGFSNPSLEKIIEAKPDLVLAGDMHLQLIKSLEDANIKVLMFSPNTMEEIFSTMTNIGRAAGVNQAASDLTAGLKTRVQSVVDKVGTVPVDQRPVVYYEVWHEPLMTASPDTLIGELITLAGGRNMMEPSKDEYPMINEETILDKNPTIMVHSYGHGAENAPSPDQIINRKGWSHISFVQSKRIYRIEANLISRAGPRIVDALEELARDIHPALYQQ